MIMQISALLLAGLPVPENRSPPCPQMTTAGIEACQQRKLAAADAQLNDTYQGLMHRLSAPERQGLLLEERRWIATRNRKCRLSPDQGTAGPLAVADCLIRETELRTEALQTRR